MRGIPFEDTCSLCDQNKVETIGTVRLCQHHLDLVNAIKADAENAKAIRRKKRKAAA